MPKRIPISTAKAVAQKHDLKQVLLIGWDGKSTHVVTYGATKEDCAIAAKAQEFWQGKIREFTFKPTEEIKFTCPYCKKNGTSIWVVGGGMLSRPDYTLVGDLIFHSVCWDKQVEENPVEGEHVYLKDVGKEDEPCWVPCAKGDPGAVEFARV